MHFEPRSNRSLFDFRGERSNAVRRVIRMRDSVLWRKLSHVTMMLAEALQIDAESALDVLYSTITYTKLVDPKTGLQLMSDSYILEDILSELEECWQGE